MALKLLARLSQALQRNKPAPAYPSESNRGGSGIPVGIGARIEQRYRLDAEIGRGGMGIVYRARDLPNNRDVAIKIINPDQANELSLQQFSREAQITSRLQNPHIVGVYEIGAVDISLRGPAPFIVMEFVQGASLDNLQGFTYARIIDIGKQICEALDYAHNQGFIHRDLKPANVIIEKRGFRLFVKLADFGLARLRGTANLPSESNAAGTVFYLAPEVIAGQPADVASDLYALGALLYQMVTGRVPFSNFFDDEKIISQHLEEAAAPPSQSREDVPPELESIILRLLAKNPLERFASAQETFQALDRVQIAHQRGNLPQSRMDFKYLEKDIARVILLLQSSQLVTLLGDANGLALAVGAGLAEQFEDGIWQVDLESLDDPAAVLNYVASSLGIRGQPNRAITVSLIENLREKNLLLILNHCQHLLGACAQLVGTILPICPEVRILADCRQPLNIPNENCYHIDPSIAETKP